MEVKLVCLTAHKKTRTDMLNDIFDENKMELLTNLYHNSYNYRPDEEDKEFLQISIAYCMREQLTSINKVSKNTFIPEVIVEKGEKYTKKSKVIVENNPVVLYLKEGENKELIDYYLSDFSDETEIITPKLRELLIDSKQ